MKWKIVNIIILLFLLSLSSFSQDIYPKKAILDNDTVAVLSIDQVKDINSRLVLLDEKFEECKELETSIGLYKESVSILEDQLSLSKKKSENLSIQISNLEKSIKINNDEYKKDKRRLILISGISVTVGIGGILTAILVK